MEKDVGRGSSVDVWIVRVSDENWYGGNGVRWNDDWVD